VRVQIPHVEGKCESRGRVGVESMVTDSTCRRVGGSKGRVGLDTVVIESTCRRGGGSIAEEQE